MATFLLALVEVHALASKLIPVLADSEAVMSVIIVRAVDVVRFVFSLVLIGRIVATFTSLSVALGGLAALSGFLVALRLKRWLTAFTGLSVAIGVWILGVVHDSKRLLNVVPVSPTGEVAKHFMVVDAAARLNWVRHERFDAIDIALKLSSVNQTLARDLVEGEWSVTGELLLARRVKGSVHHIEVLAD